MPKIEETMQIQDQIKMIFKWICIKIKFRDIIRFLICQFDLIMGQIENLIMLKN
jgi:hypothetical protein